LKRAIARFAEVGVFLKDAETRFSMVAGKDPLRPGSGGRLGLESAFSH